MKSLNGFKNYIFLMVNILFLLQSIYILVFNIKLTLTETSVVSYLFVSFMFLSIGTYKMIKVIPISIFIIIYMAVQAFGLPLAMLIDQDTAMTYLWREKLFYGEYLGEYTAISIIAITSLFISFILFRGNINKISSNRKMRNNDSIQNEKIPVKENNFYFFIGTSLIILFGLYMSFSFLNGSIPLNYSEYVDWKNNRVLNYLQFGFWFGSIFAIATSKKKNILFLLIIFSIPSIILIMSGNRNDVLYPLIIGLGVYIYRFNKIPLIPLSIVSVFVIVISPIISSTRTSGVALNTDNNFKELIASSLNEFGSQLTPISHMLVWIKYGEDYTYGLTYIFGSVVGVFGLFFSNLNGWFATTRYDISERLPALGFSMSGEIFFNFSIMGLVIIYSLIGVYWLKKESNVLSTDQLVRYSFFCFSLLFLVRNSFSTYITVVILFYMLYFFEKIFRESLKKLRKKNKSYDLD